MDNQTQLYSKRFLLKELKRNRLPHSYLTLLRYEKIGVIPTAKTAIGFGNGRWRFYTEEDINTIVDRVRKYQKGELELD